MTERIDAAGVVRDKPILLLGDVNGRRRIQRGTDRVIDESEGWRQRDLPAAIARRAGQRRPISGQRLCRWNVGKHSGRRGDGFRILVAEKEKQLVLLDRSTDHAAKLIALQLVHRRRKCVPRIQISVAQEFKRRAVEVVGARFGHHFDRPRRVLPVLRRRGTRLYFELLQRIRERQTA